jgi:hypothetical protein
VWMYPRLLGIVAVMSGFGLSEALPAGDVWKGSWKFEMDRGDNPMLAYYDTSHQTIFRIYCGTHFELDAVYPGASPKQDDTKASITIANGKTQMDFAGFTFLLDGPGSEGWPPNTTMFNQADLGYVDDDDDRSTRGAGGRAGRKSADVPPRSGRASVALLSRLRALNPSPFIRSGHKGA